jgi:diguanylate cyclase (GGDEF)-like protein
MTVVNIIASKGVLPFATLGYSLFCGASFILLLRNKIGLRFSKIAFAISFYLLFIYFIVSGNPDGFSILWIFLLPSLGLLTFGRRVGSYACIGMLALILFFFYTPFGQSLLQYEYSATLKIRFPLLYIAFFAIAYFLETVRILTYNRLSETQELYRYLYFHDALTGVYSRHGFNEKVDRYFSSEQKNLAFIILDIDHFKTVNDRYGHLQGDVVLREIAQVISSAVGHDGDVCRWGGEEFAVIIPGCDEPASVAQTLLDAVRNHAIELEGGSLSVTVSIGASLAGDTRTSSAMQLVNAADACLYRAKERGRDRIECCAL